MFEFIDKYKDISFNEKDICEIDILIFSQLSYVVYSNIDFNNKKYFVKDIVKLIDRDLVKDYIYAQVKSLELLDLISKTKRYEDCIISDYEYVVEDDMQFGALCVITPNNKLIVSFEGTDFTIAGWKEDAILSYKYPTLSQVKSGKYLSKIIDKYMKKVIVCGHSKGANLALVSSMRIPFYKKIFINSIYSFDGPGLREKEFNSFSYKMIRNKLHNIIPNQSLIGVLFNQENLDVVKSRDIGIMQHAANNWIVEDDMLVRTTQSNISKELDIVIYNWLDKYDYLERERIIDNIFILFEEAGLDKISSITDNYIKSFISIIKASKLLDKESKLVIFNCFKVLIGDVSSTIINEEISKLKGVIKDIYGKISKKSDVDEKKSND